MLLLSGILSGRGTAGRPSAGGKTADWEKEPLTLPLRHSVR